MLTEKPRNGQKVAWRNGKGELYGHSTVVSADGRLCWIKSDDGGSVNPFIWFFQRTNEFNQLAEIVTQDELN